MGLIKLLISNLDLVTSKTWEIFRIKKLNDIILDSESLCVGIYTANEISFTTTDEKVNFVITDKYFAVIHRLHIYGKVKIVSACNKGRAIFYLFKKKFYTKSKIKMVKIDFKFETVDVEKNIKIDIAHS